MNATTIYKGEIINFDAMDLCIIDFLDKKYSECKHIVTGDIIPVEHFYIKFFRKEKDSSENIADYDCIERKCI